MFNIFCPFSGGINISSISSCFSILLSLKLVVVSAVLLPINSSAL